VIGIQRIIAQALRDIPSFSMLRNALTNSLAVANPFYRQIVGFASEFYDHYHSLPKQGDWELWTATLNEPQKGGVEQALGEILPLPQEDWTPEYIATTVTTVLKSVAARSAVARLGTMVPDVPPDALTILAEEVRRVEPVTIHGLKHMSDVAMWINTHQEEEKIIRTGYTGLDSFIGGFRPELVFFLADSGVGKTTALINAGKYAALRGAQVLHITMELSAENTLRRYYRSVSESMPAELRESPQIVIDRVNHWLRFAKGSVHVLYQQPYSLDVEGLDALVDQFVQVYGPVGLVCLDYLDLMKMPANAKSEYEGLGRTSHGARGVGLKWQATMASATQATRGGHQIRHLRLDHMGDSYRKVQAADIIIAINQTQEEYEANQARLGLLKIRENPGRGVEIPVYVNMDLMIIADLDSPNTLRLMRQFQHPINHVFTYEENQERPATNGNRPVQAS
jgi:KaiC/GvpD/RAD55 family RecA-like ATPase